MPFSLSHVGFVAPLRRFLASHHLFALMVGSVAPDFGYYIRRYDLSDYSHTFAGAFVACLPLGLLAYLLGLVFLRHIACLLPEPHRGLLKASGLLVFPKTKRLMGLGIAVLVGALLHNFADSFTHKTGASVALFPFLATEVFSFGGDSFPIYRLLQYGGSVLGLIMLLAAYVLVLQKYCEAKACPLWQDRARWWTLNGIAIVSAAIAAALFLHQFQQGNPFLFSARAFAFQFLTSWPPLFAAGLFIAAFFHRRALHRPWGA